MIQLKRGINLGGFLSQCVHTVAHYDSFISETDIKKIKEYGFDHVRLPIDYMVFETEEGERKEEGFKRVHDIIGWCKNNDMPIILDLHKAYGYDFNDADNDSKNNLFSDAGAQDRFLKLWERIAKEYSKYDFVAFELLNEVVEDKNASAWNSLISRAVEVIRNITKDTPIIYGGIKYNSADTIELLDPPHDENIIFTFHFYEPLVFTHQWAYWMPQMKEIGAVNYPDSMEVYREKSKILGLQGNTVLSSSLKEMNIDYLREMVKKAVTDAAKVNAPLYVGEFGVIDQAPPADTLRWFEDTMQVFRENNIGCALWSYKDMDFGINEEHYAPIQKDMIKVLTEI
ncbi:MAG: glycoside hydrolase family 5 protein [Lachnospiraceae bacterium]|nr:glycoside hydrolase family 5 protein [Lachnospiraceae bacterium]